MVYLDNKTNIFTAIKREEWPLGDIQSVSIAPPDGTFYTGGLHRRLRITTTKDGEVLFSISHLDKRARQMQEAIFGPAKNSSG